MRKDDEMPPDGYTSTHGVTCDGRISVAGCWQIAKPATKPSALPPVALRAIGQPTTELPISKRREGREGGLPPIVGLEFTNLLFPILKLSLVLKLFCLKPIEISTVNC
jgi:hypothetical protein